MPACKGTARAITTSPILVRPCSAVCRRTATTWWARPAIRSTCGFRRIFRFRSRRPAKTAPRPSSTQNITAFRTSRPRHNAFDGGLRAVAGTPYYNDRMINFALVAALAIADAAGPTQQSALAADDRISRALLANDTATLRRLLADDWIVVSAQGGYDGRDDILQAIDAGVWTHTQV